MYMSYLNHSVFRAGHLQKGTFNWNGKILPQKKTLITFLQGLILFDPYLGLAISILNMMLLFGLQNL